ncbi:MAG: flagellar hook-associated protein FlgK [Actinomycetota bacterium]|nr:flagellar hook-associated protein FlgK [Actinomycetota bacterium]
MTQGLSIAASSIAAETTAIDTIAQNVANAQTPGYVAETPVLTTVPGPGGTGSGDGVEVSTISQATNAILSTNTWQAQGALSSVSALQQTLRSAETLFPISAQSQTTSVTSGSNISEELSAFWNSWDSIAQSPSASAPRIQTIDSAQSLVVSLRQAASQLTEITSNVNAELSDQISQVNTLLGKVASLNQAITQSVNPGNANELEDQLRQVVGTLAQLSGVSARLQADGTATVSIGGVTVVQDATAVSLTLAKQGTPPSNAIVLATSPTVEVPATTGSVAGLLSAVNRYLPAYRAELDAVATTLKNDVNAQLAKGYTATGTSGATHPLFVGTGASGLSVAGPVVADPTLLAASGTPTPSAAVNNGANAQAMAELATSPTGPDATYRTLVQNIGTDTQSANNQLAAATAVATQAKTALQAVSGVDITEQMTQLLTDQQNFEASAKLVSIVSATVQSLEQAIA